MPIQKVEHLECPKCEGRHFAVSVRYLYKDVLPLKGEEADPVPYFTCSKCVKTFRREQLLIAGTHDPAEILERALAPK